MLAVSGKRGFSSENLRQTCKPVASLAGLSDERLKGLFSRLTGRGGKRGNA
jgi:hypothetical protein